MPPLEYYIRLTKGFHEIRKSYGLVAVDDNYELCGNHPAKLLLICGQELFWSEVDVYKCHIAGPLFTDNLLRIRKKNPGNDIASSWFVMQLIHCSDDLRFGSFFFLSHQVHPLFPLSLWRCQEPTAGVSGASVPQKSQR